MIPALVMKDIRKEVKKGIDNADDKTVKMIYAMLEVEQGKDPWTDPDFLSEIDMRTKEFEQGKAKLFTLEALEKGARNSFKKRQRSVK